jgi:hypothetical protein
MKIRFKEKFSYWFDNYMASGAWSIFLALLIIFVFGFLLISLFRLIAGFIIPDVDLGAGETFWRIFLEMTDPGNMSQDTTVPWFMKVYAVASGIFGIIFFSAVIAFITTQLDLKLQQLKKGKSRVLENGHILILGWEPQQVTEIILELIIANESEKYGSVVVLAPEEKEEMDDYINEKITDRKTTRIITRKGITSSLNVLRRVGISECKSIIILPECSSFASNEQKAASDAHTLKILLAVVAATQDLEEKPSIVTQVFYRHNREIMDTLGVDSLTIVDPEDIVAKIAVQTSRSSGLAAVYSEIIGFAGCEFYVIHEEWENKAFGNLPYHFPDGIVLGIKKPDGKLSLNPGSGYVLQDEDDIVILAEDDSTIDYQSQPLFTPEDLPFVPKKMVSRKEKELIIGWNKKGKTIVEQYVDYIEKGSRIDIVLPANASQESIAEIKQLKTQLTDHQLEVMRLKMFNIGILSKLQPETYNSIIILNTTSDDLEKADAATINVLLLIRAVIKLRTQRLGKRSRTQIISEVMNSDNLELISHTGVHDAIISTKMVSKILAQVAEEPDTLSIYDEIFREEGSEIYLKPLGLYLNRIPETVRFCDLIRLAQRRQEICIGYRKREKQHDVQSNFGIVLNPPKDKDIKLSLHDCIIVLAENEL